jgi:transcriptional regulator with PAS, ATPase and Fis domain
VKDGRFREDLYYRLQVVAVNLPALRERGEDVLNLALHFIDRFNRVYGREIRGLADETADIFLRYTWPGNVRELENLLERIFILEDDDVILPRHLPDRIIRTVRSGETQGGLAAGFHPAGFHEATADFQRKLIARAMLEAHGNIQVAASALGISRHALRHQMMKLDLRPA